MIFNFYQESDRLFKPIKKFIFVTSKNKYIQKLNGINRSIYRLRSIYTLSYIRYN